MSLFGAFLSTVRDVYVSTALWRVVFLRVLFTSPPGTDGALPLDCYSEAPKIVLAPDLQALVNHEPAIERSPSLPDNSSRLAA